jgi:hypothetical protein
LSPILDAVTSDQEDRMGFMDSLREALGGEPQEQLTTPPAPPASQARHADRSAPAETADDIALVTGGKHARRD